jgi:CrcB protein
LTPCGSSPFDAIEKAMSRLLWVFLAGGLGSCVRYGAVTLTVRLFGQSYPWGVFGVNVVGSFLIALVMVLAVARAQIGEELRIALTAGFLGGLTTYSSFNQDTLKLLDGKQYATAAAYVGSTLIACLVAGVLGTLVGRRI